MWQGTEEKSAAVFKSLVFKSLTLAEFRDVVEEVEGREKESHRCKENVLATQGESGAPPTSWLENSLDVGGKKPGLFPCNVTGSHQDPRQVCLAGISVERMYELPA